MTTIQSQQNPDSAATVGLSDDGAGLRHFLAWASSHDCSHAAIALANVLLADVTSRFLRSSIDSVARSYSILSGWEAAGADTHQATEIAFALQGQVAHATTGSVRVLARSARSDFSGVRPWPYLQLAFSCREPLKVSTTELDRFRVLRSWLLVEALERARSGNRLDALLETVANGLRGAGEDDGRNGWLPVVLELAPPTTSLSGLRLYLMRKCSQRLADKSQPLESESHQNFFKATLAIARGDSLPKTARESALAAWPIAEDALIDSHEDASTSRPAWEPTDDLQDEFPDFLQGAATDSDDDEEPEYKDVEVDPQQSTGEQASHRRYISLTVAARARLTRWNWEVINPTEEIALTQKIASAYKESSDAKRSIAAISELCLVGGRSLAKGLQLVVDGSSPGEADWMIDLRVGRLRRRPPRRSRHKRTLQRMVPHLVEEAEEISVQLGGECVNVLRAMQAAAATQPGQVVRLQDFWVNATQTPGQAFHTWLRNDPILHRLTPGMLGSIAERRIYAADPDWLKARLLASPADAGLPAAAAYGAYTGDEITAAVAGWWAADSDKNAAGSLIDAHDAFYRNGLGRMRGTVDEAARGSDFIEYHNRSALYWDTALRAGSGARPAAGIWNWSWIDFKGRFAFIDDKTGVDASAARWVILPEALLTALREDYLQQHIPQAVAWLKQEFGELASDACLALRGSLVWLSRDGDRVVAEPLGPGHRELFKESAAEFPLVANAFRHRARTVWRRLGCHPEMIDSLLAHSDGASRTHGDYSPRIWQADAAASYNAVDEAFRLLAFQAPMRWHLEATTSVNDAPTPGIPEASHHPRMHARWRTLLRAARQTAEHLALLQCRTDPSLLDQLTKNRLPLKTLVAGMSSWEEADAAHAVKSLTTTPAGTPAVLGTMRLLMLGRLADRAWDATGSRIPLRRRSFSMLSRDEPRASPAGIGAKDRYERWRAILTRIITTTRFDRVKPADAGALLVAELVLGSRITDRLLLTDACRAEFRVVRWKGAPYIEWFMGASPPDLGHGVVRHRMTEHAVRLAGVLKSVKTLHHSSKSNASALLRPLIDDAQLPATIAIDELTARLCETVDALNCLELPGNVAAARAGRIYSASLAWPDWTRMPDGGFSAPEPANEVEMLPAPEAPLAPVSIPFRQMPSGSTRDAARLFNKAVRKVLNSMRVGGVQQKPSSDQRRNMSRAVGAICTRNEQQATPALVVLGRWCEALFDRKATTEMVRISSIARYFGALSPRFEALAHDLDLRDLDEEELTDLYQDMIEMHGPDRPSYVLARLREFHRFAAKESGVVSPDWSELVAEDVGLGISPGFIDEATYLKVFDRIQKHGDLHLARCGSTSAMLGYRFGLRKTEITGLRVKDLVGDIGSMHVIVERLKKRDLKSTRGRRVVPQLFDLTDAERKFMEGLLLQARERAKTDPGALLLSDPSEKAGIIDADKIAKLVNSVLKEITGNDFLTGHHLRHSFACDVWTCLEEDVEASTNAAVQKRAHAVRDRLLGEQQVGRRSPWALASVLGHTHPARAYKSYVHFLCDWADRLTFTPDQWPTTSSGSCDSHVVDLDLLPKRYPSVSPTLPKVTPEPPTIAQVMLGVRMLAEDVPPSSVASSLAVDRVWLDASLDVLKQLEERLGSDPSKSASTRYAKLSGSGLLSHILRSDTQRLARLLADAETLWKPRTSEIPLPSIDEFCGMIGYRRQFSLWLNSQFLFAKALVQGLKIDRARLSLIRPEILHSSICKLAEETGWIVPENSPPGARTEIKDTPLPFEPIVGGKQEPTRFGPTQVIHTQRFSLELHILEGQGIGNRLELIFAALCFWGWLKGRKLPASS